MDAARPLVRWWWFGAAVTKPEIQRELNQMKADGIGGAELAFVYPEVLDDPAHHLVNFPFLSPAFLEAVTFAQSEGRKLGLRIDITLCSGWPYGGPATTLAEAATRLRSAEVAVPANATSVAPPTLGEGESLVSASIVTGEVSPPPARRDPRAPGQVKSWDPSSAAPLSITRTSIDVAPSTASRVALFFIQSHTRQEVKRAAVGAEGWVLDPFSHDAVATHLRSVGEPLLRAFGNTPPYAIFSDSLEAYGADWTPTLPAEFLKRRGYDLLSHLTDLVAGGTPAAATIRHDYGKTLTELVNQNYLTQINSWAIAHNTKFRSQTYGEPAVSFSSQQVAALPEGEGPQWRRFSTLRWATSANHVFGNNVSSGETFTWLHSPVFRATPLDMKAEADIDFIMGENQLIFHGWPYSAPEAGEPGWSLYAAAVFNDHNPWHPVMPDVTKYIARISALLRQGQPANQVAILLPTDDAWANFSPGKVSVSGEMARLISPQLMSTILSAGYNIDYIDADAIDSPGLGTHQIVVIPPTRRIPVKTLQKLEAFAKSGGKVIAVGAAPTLDDQGKTSPELEKLLFAIPFVGDLDGLAAALHNETVPDLQLPATAPAATRDAIGFIRRKLPTGDIYFVANTTNQTVQTSATFATTHKFGQQMDPDIGVVTTAAIASAPLTLAPYESRIFLFSDTRPTAAAACPFPTTQLTDLSADWHVSFSSNNRATTEATLSDWTTDPATRNYSGEAVYTRDFTLRAAPRSPVYLQIEGGEPVAMPPPRESRASAADPRDPTQRAAGSPLPNPLVTGTGPGMRAWYDPPIREAAIVFLNGQRVGALWHPPYRLDITALLKAGTNHIEIRVYNTAINAWAALPPHDYKPLIARYGDRFQMQDLQLVRPIPSGILGTIHLVTQAAQ